MSKAGRSALVFAGTAAISAFAVLTWAVARSEPLWEADRALAQWVRAVHGPIATEAFRTATHLGGWTLVTLATIALVVWLLYMRHARDAAIVALIVIGGAAVSGLTKALVGRARPPAETAIGTLPLTASFPSGHTMASICLAGAILIAARRMQRPWRTIATVVAALLPLIVGVSRVYLGVHWGSDVVGGWLLGSAWIIAVVLLGSRWPAGGSA